MLPLQDGGEDSAQDEVISRVDHHLVLILAKVLNRIALTGVIIKGQNLKLLEKILMHQRDSPKSAVTWHIRFFNSLL